MKKHCSIVYRVLDCHTVYLWVGWMIRINTTWIPRLTVLIFYSPLKLSIGRSSLLCLCFSSAFSTSLFSKMLLSRNHQKPHPSILSMELFLKYIIFSSFVLPYFPYKFIFFLLVVALLSI